MGSSSARAGAHPLAVQRAEVRPGRAIRVRALQQETYARLEVEDHGPGIAPELAGNLFERFGRAGDVNHYAGLGVGLYLARQIVEAHGGQIRHQNTSGGGSTFTVDLPLRSKGAT